MSYVDALLSKESGEQRRKIGKQAAKKSLWGSIGRTVGSLGAMAISGGTLNPVTMGALSGGLSFLGGAAFSRAAGKIEKGSLHQGEAEELQSQLGALGSQNITASLKSGVTAGLGQAKKLYSAGRAAESAGKSAEEVAKIKAGTGFKEAYKDSFLSKQAEAGAERIHAGKEAGKLKDLNKLQKTTKYKETGDDLYSMFEADIQDPKLAAGYDQTTDSISRMNLDKIKDTKSSDIITDRSIRDLGSKDVGLSDISTKQLAGPKMTETKTLGSRMRNLFTKQGLSKDERGLYDTMNMMADQGYEVGPGGRLPEEFGKGFISKSGDIISDPGRVDVPVDPGFETFDDINFDEDIIDDPGFEDFKNWEGPPAYDPVTAEEYGQIGRGLSASPVDMMEGEWLNNYDMPVDPRIAPLSGKSGALQSQANPLKLGLSARNIYNKKWGG